jgi:hypothetical protein
VPINDKRVLGRGDNFVISEGNGTWVSHSRYRRTETRPIETTDDKITLLFPFDFQYSATMGKYSLPKVSQSLTAQRIT